MRASSLQRKLRHFGLSIQDIQRLVSKAFEIDLLIFDVCFSRLFTLRRADSAHGMRICLVLHRLLDTN